MDPVNEIIHGDCEQVSKGFPDNSIDLIFDFTAPYLFKAKNVTKAQDLVEGLLDARFSSSEERLFGDLLEDLAVFVVSQTCGGHKSTAQGVDLEFMNSGIHYERTEADYAC